MAKLTNALLRYKVMFTKSGSGGYTARVMLPKEAVKDSTISYPILSVSFLTPRYNPPWVKANGLVLQGWFAT